MRRGVLYVDDPATTRCDNAAYDMFHWRCGHRVTLTNNNRTATRNFSEYNYGLVFSAEPLKDDVLFEVTIDKKVYASPPERERDALAPLASAVFACVHHFLSR